MRWFGFIVLVILVLIGPNLIWLATSTVRIHNGSPADLRSVSYRACDTTQSIGTLASRESVFRFLQACGDDTLVILVEDKEFCQIYVEGELYHVNATILSPSEVHCVYDDLLSGLFITKVFW